MDWSHVITIAGTAAASLPLGAAWQGFLNKRKQDGDQKLAESKLGAELRLTEFEKTIERYESLSNDMQERIDSLEGKLEQSYRDRHKEHADCERKLGILEGRLDEQTRQVSHMHTTAVKQAAAAAQAGATEGVRAGVEAVAKTSDSAVLLKGFDKEHPLPVEVVPPKE